MGKFFKKFDERTPAERANFEKSRVGLRIVICGYVIYLGIKLIVDRNTGDSAMNPTTAIIIGALLIAAGAALLVMAFVQLSRSFKYKEFDKLTYYKQKFGPDFTEEDMYRYEEELEKAQSGESAPEADAADTAADAAAELPETADTAEEAADRIEEFSDEGAPEEEPPEDAYEETEDTETEE